MVSPLDKSLPHLELFALMVFFAGLTLLLSQVLPTRRLASGLASAPLLASYTLEILLELDDRVADIERFSALHYIKGGYAIKSLNLDWTFGLSAAGLLFTILAFWRFDRCELRISGEGNWNLWMFRGEKLILNLSKAVCLIQYFQGMDISRHQL